MPRSWMIHDYSGYRGLRLNVEPLGEPGPGEVRLRVEAFSLNWGDMSLMEDHYSFHFARLPARVGIEAAGIVDAVGPGVEGWSIGDRAATLPYFYYERGASTESLVIDARYVTKAHDGLSAVENASIWMRYLTAYYPIAEVTPVGVGSHVLVTGATGTAGSAALEIGRVLGATMIGTTRSADNIGYLRAAGADEVIVTGRDDLAERLATITGGRGIDVAFDAAGATLLPLYSPALARDARIYFYGELDGRRPELPFVDMFQKNAVFHPYSVFNYVADADLCARGVEFVNDMLARGLARPQVDRVYPMNQYIEAFEYLRGPRTSHGKVVIETGL